MTTRVKIHASQPAAWKAMYGLEQYLTTTSVSKTHKEFIKLRASQINHCAFCIDMHSKDALKNGETTQRLLLLDAWRETDLFTEEEKVVLAITEEITLISEKGLTEETYQNALKYFSEDYIAQVIMIVVAINAWNRISVSTHITVGEKF